MPVTDISHDLERLTLTITAQFAAPDQRIWDIYADPRQLEKVWGPPECPATFVDHALTPGGRMTYYMTMPDGQRVYGIWDILAVDEPHSFTLRDAFADETFTPNQDLPSSEAEYRFEEADGGTRCVFVTRYASREDLQQVLDMGVEEGSRSAIDQIDDLIAAWRLDRKCGIGPRPVPHTVPMAETSAKMTTWHRPPAHEERVQEIAQSSVNH